jgi:micrococcal nuclease
MPFEYHARVNKVIDGDTINVDIDLGFNTILSNQSVRLLGIDTPESRTSDKVEKVFGNLSKEKVKEFIDKCEGQIILQISLGDSEEKFGRLLGKVINPKGNSSLNEWLIWNNYAVAYNGENKNKVQEAHLSNRKILIDKKEVKMSYAEAGVK